MRLQYAQVGLLLVSPVVPFASLSLGIDVILNVVILTTSFGLCFFSTLESF